jgi:hypothetical protein
MISEHSQFQKYRPRLSMLCIFPLRVLKVKSKQIQRKLMSEPEKIRKPLHPQLEQELQVIQPIKINCKT